VIATATGEIVEATETEGGTEIEDAHAHPIIARAGNMKR
jgi:hypothetical protein